MRSLFCCLCLEERDARGREEPVLVWEEACRDRKGMGKFIILLGDDECILRGR